MASAFPTWGVKTIEKIMRIQERALLSKIPIVYLVDDEDVVRAVWALLGDSARRREMRTAGLMTVDGEGAARIAGDIAREFRARGAGGLRRAG